MRDPVFHRELRRRQDKFSYAHVAINDHAFLSFIASVQLVIFVKTVDICGASGYSMLCHFTLQLK
jgi:hypothetical protein